MNTPTTVQSKKKREMEREQANKAQEAEQLPSDILSMIHINDVQQQNWLSSVFSSLGRIARKAKRQRGPRHKRKDLRYVRRERAREMVIHSAVPARMRKEKIIRCRSERRKGFYSPIQRQAAQIMGGDLL